MQNSRLNRLKLVKDSRYVAPFIISCQAIREGDLWRITGNCDEVSGLFTDEEKTALGARNDVFMVTLTVRDKVS